MKKAVMIIATLSVFLGGCGNDEAPKMKQAEENKPMQESPATPMEQTQPSEPMTEAAPMGEAPAMSGEATGESMPAAAPAAGSEPAAGMTEGEPAADTTMTAADGGKGKQIYDSVCFACHAMAVAGAPKFGDKEAWAPRIAQGMDTLFTHAINGFQGKSGVMPPKGGRTDLSDEDVKAAVTYMVDNAK